MSLILTAAPRPKAEGMNANASRLVPGEAPPFVSPHCAKCGIPPERMTIDWISSPYYLAIQATCHGKTTGKRFPHDEVLRKSKCGGVLWMFNDG